MKKKVLAAALGLVMILQCFTTAYAQEIPEQDKTILVVDGAEAQGTETTGLTEESLQEPETTALTEESLQEPEMTALTEESLQESETTVLTEESLQEPETTVLTDEIIELAEDGMNETLESADETETSGTKENAGQTPEDVFWDEEITLDLTDTAQVSTVSQAAQRTGDAHTHEMSVGCGHGSNDLEFQPISSASTVNTQIQNGGNFYLTGNLTASTLQISIPEGVTVNLCLNGYSISPSSMKTGYRVFISGTLNLCDCVGTGCIKNGRGSSSVANNYSGGGIRNNGTFRMYGGSVTENGNSLYNSAGIYSAGDTYLYGGSVKNNTSNGNGAGAGVYAASGTLTLDGAEISGNTTTSSSSRGGGVYVENAAFVMKSGSIIGNSSGGDGGGICIRNTKVNTDPATFEISGGTIAENTAEKCGGAIYLSGHAQMVLTDGGTIAGNSANDEAGAIYMMGVVSGATKKNAVFKMQGGIIEENTTGGAGAVHLQGISEFHMYGGEIRSNESKGGGGGLYALYDTSVGAGGTITLEGGSIHDNKTDGEGGGAWIAGKTVTLSGTQISGNTASYGGGIALVNKGLLHITGGQISGNTASGQGGGIDYGGGRLTIKGSPVITGNTAGERTDNLYIDYGTAPLAVEGAFADGASVGITTYDKPDQGRNIVFTEAADADYSGYFSSDDPKYAVWNDADNSLYLKVPEVYALNWQNMEGAGWPDGVEAPVSYLCGIGLAELPVPVRNGWRFDGWFSGADMSAQEQVTAIGRKEEGDRALWAKWTDVQAPSLTAKLEKESASGWYSSVSVLLNCSDNGTEYPALSVKMDGGAFQPVRAMKDGRWNAAAEGVHTYIFQAADEAGNTVQSESLTIRLDQTAPVFGAVSWEGKQGEDGVWAVGRNARKAVITIQEEQSGVSEIRYVLNEDGGTAQSGAANVKDNRAVISVPADFTGTIRVNCTDAVGLAAEELRIRLESERPEYDAKLRLANTLAVKGKKLVAKWDAVEGADGYEVYAAKCGGNMKLVKTVASKDGKSEYTAKIKKIGGKKIKKNGNYKAQVKAYCMVDGEKFYLASGLVLHAAGPSNRTGTNASKLKASKKTYTVGVGKRVRLSVQTIRQDSKKALLSDAHGPKLRYWSTDESVAAVSASGYIRGKKKGVCYVCATAQNGVTVRVKVKVK